MDPELGDPIETLFDQLRQRRLAEEQKKTFLKQEEAAVQLKELNDAQAAALKQTELTETRVEVDIAGNRGASWMDGRFLQSTINLTRGFNDAKPDVDCGGEGGLAAPRAIGQGTNALMADGSVRFVSSACPLETWKIVATRAGGEVIPPDF